MVTLREQKESRIEIWQDIAGDNRVTTISLAFESLGTRGMATFASTGDLGILIDPGVDLAAMRFNLPPPGRKVWSFRQPQSSWG